MTPVLGVCVALAAVLAVGCVVVAQSATPF
jgi:hypothetical protein